MSGIVGSKLNIRGSGRIAKLGTDGQVLTSSGAGVQANYEDVAAGISWQSVVTASTFTAVAGNGYPVNTTSNACTVTLPASASVGDEIIFTDYARNFATNALTIDQNSLKYQGQTSPNPVYNTAGESIHIVYMDVTNGWIPINDGAVANEVPQFVGTGIEYLVVGGGGGGANGSDGEKGQDSYISGTGLTTITATGGGGAPEFVNGTPKSGEDGGSGSGASGMDTGQSSGAVGSGNEGGSGGAPSIAEGYDGGSGASGTHPSGGGGGGASEVGANAVSVTSAGDGGDGLANSITGSSVTYAGGGGGGIGSTYTVGAGGSGGGGTGANTVDPRNATSGTDGLGGGGGGLYYVAGGGAGGYRTNYGDTAITLLSARTYTIQVGTGGAGRDDGTYTSGDGGDGVVILRMTDNDYDASSTSGSPTVTQDVGGSGETVIKWTGDGTFVTP